MSHRRSSPALLFLFLLLAILCVALAAASWFGLGLPQRAADVFGPPSPTLSALQRYTYSAQLLLEKNDLTTPANPQGSEQQFTIGLGESVGSVATRLEEAGLVPSASAFRNYLIYAGLDTGLQAGNYTLSPALPAMQIAAKLQDATPSQVDFTILEGWRLEEIAAALPTSGLQITPEEFLSAVKMAPTGYSFSEGLPEVSSLEGFLMPDAYTLKRDVSVGTMLTILLKNFDSKLTPDIRQGFQRQGLTLYQGVTLASIVQREAVVKDEQPLIASVFLNRLASGMKLDSDPTVQYALGYNDQQATWWTNPLSADDLKTDSPYNTYLYVGLPPGPIDEPGLSALQAVAYPAQTPYYYFRARCDGSGRHEFARTYEEQLNNACPQ